ncbi:MAG: hypothetical protein HZB79_09525 [Deltaproteobacteria bacterium]|nr:hypothetical protein [Deltaproteobacteria bacterium]
MENSARQDIEKEILKQAIEMIEGQGGYPSAGRVGVKGQDIENAIILASEKWHQGVIGVVASKLVDIYYRPTILISLSGDAGKGSARGIKAFHILEGLQECSQHLERFGGHKAAAGLSINKSHIPAFKEAFLNAATHLKHEDFIPALSLDASIHLDELNEKMVTEMDSLAPFGLGNPEPLFCSRETRVVQSQIVGSNHLRFKATQKNRVFNAIAFGFGDMHPLSDKYMDMAFTPQIEEWNGNRDLKLNVKGMKTAA